MKKIVIATFLFIACNTQQKDPPQKDLSQQAAREIMQADKDMSDLALKEGFYKALLFYADDSVIKPQEGQLPVIGKAALEKYWSNKADTKDISWQPFKAEAAKSGDWGYTLGNWKYASKDTTMYGNYYTMWKKQPDGKWKFTVDGGNNTPKP
jgi:ketosteroid isomerase-like protein